MDQNFGASPLEGNLLGNSTGKSPTGLCGSILLSFGSGSVWARSDPGFILEKEMPIWTLFGLVRVGLGHKFDTETLVEVFGCMKSPAGRIHKKLGRPPLWTLPRGNFLWLLVQKSGSDPFIKPP